MKGGSKVIVTKHRHEGVFVAKGKEDSICTLNLVPGESVYGEKRISTEVNGEKIEYRIWNPFRSKIAAAVVGGISWLELWCFVWFVCVCVCVCLFFFFF